MASTKTLFEWSFAKDPSGRTQTVLNILQAHWAAGLAAFAGYALLCGSLWLFADVRDRLEILSRSVPVFVRSNRLEPWHFSLVNFQDAYLDHPEYREAQQALGDYGRVVIKGRPKAGKTRMAYNLAKQQSGVWILKTREDFVDWAALDIPSYKFFYRPRILWIVDDVDKLLGKATLSQAMDVLGNQCGLQMIVTCRIGEEWNRVVTDSAFCSVLEPMRRVDCSDFLPEELD